MRLWRLIFISFFLVLLSDYFMLADNFFTFRKNIFNQLIDLKAFDNEEKLIDIMDSIYLANKDSKDFLVSEYRYLRYDLINESYDKEKFKKGILVFHKAMYYYILELFAKSYEEFQKSAEIFKELGAYAYVFDSYMMCAILSIDTKDHGHAQKLIHQASLWLPKIKNDTIRLDRTAILNWNYGKFYLNKGDLDKAKFHLDSSRKLVEYLKNLKSIYQVDWNYYIVYLTLSKYFEQKGQLDSALAMYNEIKNLNKILISNHDLFTYQLTESIVKIYLKQKKYKLAINTINQYFKDLYKGSELYGKFYIPKAKLALYDELAEAYYQLGDYEHSYKIQKELNQIYAQTMLEYKPLDAISAKLDMEHKLREEQLQQKMINITFAIVASIIFLSALLYFNRYKKIQKLNNQLFELNETKNRLFSIISHDLRGPILSVNQSLELFLNKFDLIDNNRKIEIVQNVQNSISRITNLLENLLNWSAFQIKNTKSIKEEIAIAEVIDSVIDQVDFLAKAKNIEIKKHFENCENIFMNRNELEVLLRNIISNSIKFSPPNEVIDVYVNCTDNKVVFEITDHGIGITEEEKNLIMNIERRYRKTGTNGERGSGLGLFIVKDILNRNNGKIEFQNNIPQGTKVQVEIPV